MCLNFLQYGKKEAENEADKEEDDRTATSPLVKHAPGSTPAVKGKKGKKGEKKNKLEDLKQELEMVIINKLLTL